MLHATLKINDFPIEDFTAVRITNIDKVRPGPDDVSEYRVSFNEAKFGGRRVEGIISHRYGDGAWKLLEKSIKELL